MQCRNPFKCFFISNYCCQLKFIMKWVLILQTQSVVESCWTAVLDRFFSPNAELKIDPRLGRERASSHLCVMAVLQILGGGCHTPSLSHVENFHFFLKNFLFPLIYCPLPLSISTLSLSLVKMWRSDCHNIEYVVCGMTYTIFQGFLKSH